MMSFCLRYALSAALVTGGLFAAVVENDELRVELDESNGSLTVADKRTSRVWRSMVDDHPITVEDVRAAGPRIRFKGKADGVKGDLVGEVALDGEKVLCSLDAPAAAAFAVLRSADIFSRSRSKG